MLKQQLIKDIYIFRYLKNWKSCFIINIDANIGRTKKDGNTRQREYLPI